MLEHTVKYRYSVKTVKLRGDGVMQIALEADLVFMLIVNCAM